MFIAVAGFAQFSPEYETQISPYKNQIAQRATVIVSADTEPVQLVALEKGLSSINIGQKPNEMGYIGAKMLYQYIRAGIQPLQEFTYLGFHTCTIENAHTCTSEK